MTTSKEVSEATQLAATINKATVQNMNINREFPNDGFGHLDFAADYLLWLGFFVGPRGLGTNKKLLRRRSPTP